MEQLHSPICEAAARCLAAFDELLSISDNNLVPSAVEDNHARFRIWAGNLGAFKRLPSNASADFRLREAPEVSSRILEILQDISETNEELQSLLTAENGSVGEVDGGGNFIEDLCLSVGDSITSLLKVSALLRKATTRDRYAIAAASKLDALPTQYAWYDEKHLKEKYPKVRNQPWLCERLASAITQRRRYLRYAQRHQQRIANERPATKPLPEMVHDTVFQPLSRTGDRASLGLTISAIAASTKASTLQVAKVNNMALDGSDLDDDDNMSQATSFISAASGTDNHSRAQVIKLEDLTKNNEPFECPYCRGVVQYKNQRAWRKHVFRDLRAYVCTFPDCDANLFEDRNTWLNHEVECHRRVWICLGCSSKTFHTENSFRSHLQKIHGYAEENVLSSISKSSSRPLAEVSPTECPFCDDWAEQLGISTEQRDTTTVALSLLKQHLGGHHEQLAIFAVTPDYEHEVDSETGSHASDVSEAGKKEGLVTWQSHIDNTRDIDDTPDQDETPELAAAYDSDDGSDPPLLYDEEYDIENAPNWSWNADPEAPGRGVQLTAENLRSNKVAAAAGNAHLLDMDEIYLKEHERLNYSQQPQEFFKIGRVFELWPYSPWEQPQHDGESGESNDETPSSSVLSIVGKFLVIERLPKGCLAVPIRTYGDLTTTGVHGRRHAMIYSGTSAPVPFREEITAPMTVALCLFPFKVDLDGIEGLPIMSRIEFGSASRVPLGAWVANIGVLDVLSIAFLLERYLELSRRERTDPDTVPCRLCSFNLREPGQPTTTARCEAKHSFHTACYEIYEAAVGSVVGPVSSCPVCRVELGTGIEGHPVAAEPEEDVSQQVDSDNMVPPKLSDADRWLQANPDACDLRNPHRSARFFLRDDVGRNGNFTLMPGGDAIRYADASHRDVRFSIPMSEVSRRFRCAQDNSIFCTFPDGSAYFHREGSGKVDAFEADELQWLEPPHGYTSWSRYNAALDVEKRTPGDEEETATLSRPNETRSARDIEHKNVADEDGFGPEGTKGPVLWGRQAPGRRFQSLQSDNVYFWLEPGGRTVQYHDADQDQVLDSIPPDVEIRSFTCIKDGSNLYIYPNGTAAFFNAQGQYINIPHGRLDWIPPPVPLQSVPEEAVQSSSPPQEVTENSSPSLTSVFDMMKDFKSVPFPYGFVAELEKRITGVLQGKEPMPEYNDLSIKRTFATFLNEFKGPTFRILMEKDGRVDDLLLIFFSKATNELQRGKDLDDKSCKLAVNRHVALFARIMSSTLGNNEDWTRVELELISKLNTLETRLLQDDSDADENKYEATIGLSEQEPTLIQREGSQPPDDLYSTVPARDRNRLMVDYRIVRDTILMLRKRIIAAKEKMLENIPKVDSTVRRLVGTDSAYQLEITSLETELSLAESRFQTIRIMFLNAGLEAEDIAQSALDAGSAMPVRDGPIIQTSPGEDGGKKDENSPVTPDSTQIKLGREKGREVEDLRTNADPLGVGKVGRSELIEQRPSKNESIDCMWPGCSRYFFSEEEAAEHMQEVHNQGIASRSPDLNAAEDAYTRPSSIETQGTISSKSFHPSDGNYICDHEDCQDDPPEFDQVGELAKHYKNKHSAPEDLRFECDTCGKREMWEVHMVRHVRMHSDTRPFQCRFCTATYSRNDHATRHEKDRHGKEFKKAGPRKSTTKHPQTRTDEPLRGAGYHLLPGRTRYRERPVQTGLHPSSRSPRHDEVVTQRTESDVVDFLAAGKRTIPTYNELFDDDRSSEDGHPSDSEIYQFPDPVTGVESMDKQSGQVLRNRSNTSSTLPSSMQHQDWPTAYNEHGEQSSGFKLSDDDRHPNPKTPLPVNPSSTSTLLPRSRPLKTCSVDRCGRRFPHESDLDRHMIIHHGIVRYVCPLDRYTTSWGHRIREHCRSTHKQAKGTERFIDLVYDDISSMSLPTIQPMRQMTTRPSSSSKSPGRSSNVDDDVSSEDGQQNPSADCWWPHCSRRFQSAWQMNDHLKSSHGAEINKENDIVPTVATAEWLLVHNVPILASEGDLQQCFGQVGPVSCIVLPTERAKGFAAVEFMYVLAFAVDSARRKLDGTELMGNTLRVVRSLLDPRGYVDRYTVYFSLAYVNVPILKCSENGCDGSQRYMDFDFGKHMLSAHGVSSKGTDQGAFGQDEGVNILHEKGEVAESSKGVMWSAH